MPLLDASDDLPDTPDPDILQLLNDVKRSELEDQYGIRFHHGSTSRIPPEIEQAWLEHIEEFQRNVRNAEMISLRLFVGLGYVRPLADLPAGAVETELKALLTLLKEQDITVDFPESMKPAEVYGLIAEGLLEEPVPNFRIPGVRRHYSFRIPE
jgi:hypothetical protein